MWMDLESIMLSEISQTEKDKYSYVTTYMWNLQNKLMNITKLNRFTDIKNKLVITSVKREVGRGIIGVGD